ncbi:MAG TPA: hypothetical protein VJV96_02350 [Candidatus Angelobacter sp.]|nr:hypothetical protein [Candidatus Angelobacter sp.]
MTTSPKSPDAFLAIFWGGLLCGVFDITQAFTAWGLMGIQPVRILRHIASGLLGPAAYRGGAGTAALGLMLHFVIAFGAATVYYIASRWISFMTEHAVISGLLYGECVFLFMNFVVVPLSRTPKGHFTLATLITGPIGHTVLVGLPIALSVRRFAPTLSSSAVSSSGAAGGRA